MPALEPQYLTMLEKTLAETVVPHLPPLLDKKKPVDEQKRKNLSRAFSAFALRHVCGITEQVAAQAVIDDFGDSGVDAIHYQASTQTLYLVQGKLKQSKEFKQEDALPFVEGIRRLLKQDFVDFNENVQNRAREIEDALENCSRIELIVAHIGAGISTNAEKALLYLLKDQTHGEERFSSMPINYDAACVKRDLLAQNAYAPVDTDVFIDKCQSIEEPHKTYFGLIQLDELANLHKKYGDALYEKNIRTFLGHKTNVNASIRQTLQDDPASFFFLNNGIAALCKEIERKGPSRAHGGKRLLRIRGLSVINGAQTIASAARFLEENADADISKAQVSVTLISTAVEDEFGRMVTRARNHQNPVSLTDFVALHEEQERLRRELAYLGVHYVYKADAPYNHFEPDRISVEEASQALALFHIDPRFTVWLKKEPAKLLDTSNEQYEMIFSSDLTSFQLLNAVRFSRYIQQRMSTEASSAVGQERLAYKHGSYALGWVLAKRLRDVQREALIFDETKLASQLSLPFDDLRQVLWSEAQKIISAKGPLALFRNQTELLPLLLDLMVHGFHLAGDPVVGHKKNQQDPGQPYSADLFSYLASKAPQIGNVV